jgi:hypothetical protein
MIHLLLADPSHLWLWQVLLHHHEITCDLTWKQGFLHVACDNTVCMT